MVAAPTEGLPDLIADAVAEDRPRDGREADGRQLEVPASGEGCGRKQGRLARDGETEERGRLARQTAKTNT